LSEYAYLLQPGGRLYCITDVQELHEWHVDKCNNHPLFRRLPESDLKNDSCVGLMKNETEESQKVARAGGEKYYAVYERIRDEEARKLDASAFFS
jgi:tRNA (guanine-N7-)-methyltransferase